MNMKKELLLMLLTLPLFAGDTANIHFMGFSPSGDYVAFQQSGTQDGSGFPYAELYIIETEKNNYAVKPLKITIQDPEGKCNQKDCTEQDVLRKTVIKRKKKLLRTKISSKYKGSGIALNDLNTKDNLTTTNLMIDSQLYTLELNVTEAGKDPYMNLPLQKFTLSLKYSQGRKVLQHDRSLPKSRGYVLSYKIHSVYTLNHYLAVILSCKKVGFEGPDTRYMMVTTKLPTQIKKSPMMRRSGIKKIRTKRLKMKK